MKLGLCQNLAITLAAIPDQVGTVALISYKIQEQVDFVNSSTGLEQTAAQYPIKLCITALLQREKGRIVELNSYLFFSSPALPTTPAVAIKRSASSTDISISVTFSREIMTVFPPIW